MPDLLALESHGSRWPQVHTPAQIGALSLALAYHPDQTYASYILRGFTEGFHIGANRHQVCLQSCGYRGVTPNCGVKYGLNVSLKAVNTHWVCPPVQVQSSTSCESDRC